MFINRGLQRVEIKLRAEPIIIRVAARIEVDLTKRVPLALRNQVIPGVVEVCEGVLGGLLIDNKDYVANSRVTL